MRSIKVESSIKRLREVYVIASFLNETELLVDFTAANEEDWGPAFKERLAALLKICSQEEKAMLLRMSSAVFSEPRLKKIHDAQQLIWKEFLQISLSPHYDPNNLFWAEVFKTVFTASAAGEDVSLLAELLEKRVYNLSVLLRIEPFCTLYPASQIITRKRKSAASLRP